jgi:hypothetical protein
VVNGDHEGREVERLPPGQMVTSVVVEARWESYQDSTTGPRDPEFPPNGNGGCRELQWLAAAVNGDQKGREVERIHRAERSLVAVKQGGNRHRDVRILSSIKRQPRLSGTGVACCCSERRSKWSGGGAALHQAKRSLVAVEARWRIVSGFKRQGSQMLGFRQTATEVVGTWIGLLVHGTAIKRVGRWSGSHRAKWQLRWSWKQGGNRLQYQSLSTAGSTVLNSAKRQFRLSGHKSFLRFVDRWPKGSGGGAASCRTGRLLR